MEILPVRVLASSGPPSRPMRGKGCARFWGISPFMSRRTARTSGPRASCFCWMRRAPKEVAGCPPDYFRPTASCGATRCTTGPTTNKPALLVGRARALCAGIFTTSAHRPFPRVRHLLRHPLRCADAPKRASGGSGRACSLFAREAGAGRAPHRGRGFGRAVSECVRVGG